MRPASAPRIYHLGHGLPPIVRCARALQAGLKLAEATERAAERAEPQLARARVVAAQARERASCALQEAGERAGPELARARAAAAGALIEARGRAAGAALCGEAETLAGQTYTPDPGDAHGCTFACACH